MSKTKLKDVFLKAAQLVDEGEDTYADSGFFLAKSDACAALGVDAPVCDKADRLMDEHYPAICGECMFCEPKDDRILAFCFLAAIAEARGL